MVVMTGPLEQASDVVRRPVAWRIRPGIQPGHCQGRRGTRRCQDPVAVVTWRWWRSAEAGRVLLSERFVCDEHGREFAARHRIEIEPFPGERGMRES